MPDKITFDDAFQSPTVAKSGAITFDDAFANPASMRTTQIDPGRPARDIPSLAGTAARYPGRAPLTRQEPYPATEASFGASLKSKLVEDPDTKRRLVAESLFPGDPGAINRVGFINDRAVFVNDDGKLQYVSGGASNLGAAALANAPEFVGGTVGSFAASPVIGATLGAMGAKGLKRAIVGAAFDEPQTIPGNMVEVAGEGALNLVAGGIGKGIGKFADRGKIIDLTPADVKSAEQARLHIKDATGIDLDLAQASGNRTLLGLRDYAARSPGKSAELIQAADDAAAGQFDNATERVLSLIAKAEPSEISGMRGANAAKLAIKVAREKVSHEVRPLYDAAYAAVPEVSTATKQGEKILDYLKLPYFQEAFRAGQTLRALETGSAVKPRARTVENLVKRDAEAGTYESATTTVESTSTGARRITSKLASGEKRDTPDGVLTKRTTTTHSDITDPSLAELDYTKRALDEKIDSLIESGSRQRARALKIKRDEFVKALDALPNQEWQLARKRYGELIKEGVEPLENGAVGIIAKIENPYAANAASRILSDANMTPKQINLARVKIEQQDPEAWNGLVRQWLGQKWDASLKVTQGGDVINPAGKLRQAVYGTPNDRAKMAAMLTPQTSEAFEDLMKAAEALAKTPLGASRVAGSNTARDLELNDSLKSTGGVVFKWLTSPRKSIQDAAEQRAKEQNILAITEAITNPAKRNQLRLVARMQPSTRQAILLVNLLGGQVAQRAVAGGVTQLPSESMPPER